MFTTKNNYEENVGIYQKFYASEEEKYIIKVYNAIVSLKRTDNLDEEDIWLVKRAIKRTEHPEKRYMISLLDMLSWNHISVEEVCEYLKRLARSYSCGRVKGKAYKY